MRKWLSTYFDLSRREFNGFLVMAGLIFMVSVLPGLYRFIRPELEYIPSEQLAVSKLAAAAAPIEHDRGELFYFDPNSITAEQWQKLGLSSKQAGSVLKYIAKGGNFESASDLQKMYTISPEVYRRIAPYVRIETLKDQNKAGTGHFSSAAGLSKISSASELEHGRPVGSSVPIVEINQADSAMLVGIRGIGPAFARRILKYRERLGGFYKKEQLREVYGLDSAKYEEIKLQVSVDPLQVKKIDINSATFDLLKNCPYLKYKQVNAIIEYRKQHGDYASVEDMMKIAILDAETLNRLAPYLIF